MLHRAWELALGGHLLMTLLTFHKMLKMKAQGDCFPRRLSCGLDWQLLPKNCVKSSIHRVALQGVVETLGGVA